ncbi:MAG: N-acetylglucosamine kinase [Chitinophagaceae bacterium]|nr:N-acetylglucosamine kinase [Chitinophagaceae bacterium]
MAHLIADSGSTSCDWCYVNGNKKQKFSTIGISPYFLSENEIVEIFSSVRSKIKNQQVDKIYFYGTGLGNINNVAIIKTALKRIFSKVKIEVNTDLNGAARALLQHNKGIACILGTGSNVGFYNGKKITKTSPALGYVLGDEGSGAYLGKKVLQYYLYNTFDDELKLNFEKKYNTTSIEILDKTYKQKLPNRYLASFANFLSENRGHFMIENIIEDGLHEFIYQHLYKFAESWTYPICFTGSIAYSFKDAIKEMFQLYELKLGKIVKKPIDGLVTYHDQ